MSANRPQEKRKIPIPTGGTKLSESGVGCTAARRDKEANQGQDKDKSRHGTALT